MKYLKIILFTLFFNFSHANSCEYKSRTDSIFYTKKELEKKYSSKNYKLIYEKEHTYKNIKNQFFVFAKLDKLGIETNRVLITCQKKESKFKILSFNSAIIYNGTYCQDVTDSFSKITTKGLYVTFEEYAPTKYLKEIVHEFFTFKFDLESSKYFLDKYSIIVEHIDIDKYPVETLTKEDFGKIELEDFYFGIIDKYKSKFPDYIFEKLLPNDYWIKKHDK